MQYIIASFIVGVFIGVCLMYITLYQYFKKLKAHYSENITVLQDEINYYRRNENTCIK